MNEQALALAGKIIPPLLMLGWLLKNAFPKFPNRFIPLLTWLLAVPAFVVFSGDASAKGLVTAAMVALTATGIHSGIKNTLLGSDGDSADGGAAAGMVGLWLVTCLAAFSLVGCARFTTRQTDANYTDAGAPLRTIETKATAWTLFSSRSDLAKFKASQSDKTQTAEVGSLSQQGGTNTAATLSALTGLLQTLRPAP